MATFLEGLTAGIKSAWCAVNLGPIDWYVGLFDGTPLQAVNDAQERLIRGVCDKPPDFELPLPNPPFTGGQCYATYSFTFTATDLEGNRTSTQQGTAGKLVGTDVRINPNNGNPTAGFLRQLNPTAPIDFIGIQLGNPGADLNPVISDVVRTDGLPDNCGDPSIPIGPPAPVERPVNITYEGDDNVEYNLTVPVLFAPVYVDVDGSVRIPISIGDLNFKGTLTLAPEFKVEIDLPELPRGPQPENPQLPPSGDPGLDFPVNDPTPQGTIVGVVVRSERSGPVRSTTIFLETMPDVIAPRCATVRFLCRFGSITSWTTDQPVKGVNEYVQCPSPFGAIDVQVDWETNWTGVSTAIRSRPPADFEP